MEPTKSPSKANELTKETELRENEKAAVRSSSDHGDNQGAEPGSISEDGVRKSIGATPQSLKTGRHDAESDANETEDGLTDSEEMVRKAAEDLPADTPENSQDTPVFDRGDTLPRV